MLLGHDRNNRGVQQWGRLNVGSEVTIRIESNGRVFSGRGANTDIIVASSHAYVNALNKMLFAQNAAAGK